MLRVQRCISRRRLTSHALRSRAHIHSNSTASRKGRSETSGPSTLKKAVPLALITVGAAGLAYVSARNKPIRNDAAAQNESVIGGGGAKSVPPPSSVLDGEHLTSIVLGSNRCV